MKSIIGPVPIGKTVKLHTNYVKDSKVLEHAAEYEVIGYIEGKSGLMFVVKGNKNCNRIIPVSAYKGEFR